ncbi:2,4-dihydroxyhept-2-ene-1,7-dioic acid aldolase [Paracoccus stylophorae]|uniref:2,4-dihydroxyhept-2-ene-1,7-dioic acid aldolase n=1 Tax=Paracoccus stylophorae TaxID=659350 RepID=A0ABY7SR61_9RHOB|nr:aldolase/citrate lyase family protein [Paracoccus stylophorae]WCR09512.1 2,4-dihydroxyhept-2-ene-1,7-dioic acid aldolase [Paracoccus stylophorae]
MRLTSDDFRAYFAAGNKAVNGWCCIPSMVTAEIVARSGFDMLTVDMQHGLIDYQVALAMLQAMSASPAPKFVRIPWNEPGIAMKMLDAGATGIVCPMVNTPDQARALVSATRYAPLGTRSYGPTRAGSLHPDYVARSGGLVQVFAMIETAQALAHRDAIMQVEGLSGVYVGPADLGLSLGHEPTLQPDAPEVLEAIGAILTSARQAGLMAGIHCGSGAMVANMLHQGFDFASLSTDTGMFTRALAASLAEARTRPETT